MRFQHYFQYQVLLKPTPDDVLELYLGSLRAMGLDTEEHDIRFVEDDWEQPTVGAWGLGWEVWADGMEITQFTYFQQVAGMELDLIPAEITYGLDRLAMVIQDKPTVFDLEWAEGITWRDVFQENERQWSHYNFEEADVEMLMRHFEDYEREARRLVERGLPLPAYDQVLKSNHAFNLLDARGAISVTERAAYIGRVRNLVRAAAQVYLEREEERCRGCCLRSAARSCRPPPAWRRRCSCRSLRASTSARRPSSCTSGRGGSRSRSTCRSAPRTPG